MSFELTVGLRFLLSRRSRMLTVVSVITVLGVAFGVMALLVTLAVVDGFRAEYKKSVLAFNAHVIVLQGDQIEDLESIKQDINKLSEDYEIKGVSPFIYREGLAVQGNQVRGLAVKAVDLPDYWQLSGMPHQAINDVPGLWIGKALREEMGDSSKPLKLRLPAGTGPAETGSFTDMALAGQFSTGMYDYDASFALIDRRLAQETLGFGEEVSGVEIWLADADLAPELTSRLSDALSFPYTVLSWQDLNAHLFGALQLERLVFGLIMGILILVASFNISGTLTMRILEKRGDIAILRAMGASWRQLRRLFFYQGLALGWLGCGLGVGLGLVLITVLQRAKPLKLAADIYFVEFVPARWDITQVILTLGVTTLFAWLATRLALLRLGRLSVAEALGEI